MSDSIASAAQEILASHYDVWEKAVNRDGYTVGEADGIESAHVQAILQRLLSSHTQALQGHVEELRARLGAAEEIVDRVVDPTKNWVDTHRIAQIYRINYSKESA